jgi:DnaJ-class molecular chaperone
MIKRNKGLMLLEVLPCPTCNGSGKVVTGYSVVCTELVEKVEKCPDCNGAGYSERQDQSKIDETST